MAKETLAELEALKKEYEGYEDALKDLYKQRRDETDPKKLAEIEKKIKAMEGKLHDCGDSINELS